MEIVLIVVVAAMLIFFMFNNRKKQKARQDQLSNDLVPGATVMTTFGLYGTVVSVDTDENKVTIESGPGTTFILHKQAIGQIQAPQAVETAVEGDAVDASDPVAEPATDEADDAQAADGTPRITDAELDAMNEAKRAQQQDEDAAGDASETPADDEAGSTQDADEPAGTVDDSSDKKSESDQ